MADRPDYFQTALSNFATDLACGGAIRHLTDSGCTLDQIVDRLDYPTSRAKVQKLMMEHLYDTRVLLRKEPSAELFAPKKVFVQEQGAYGRRSMRKIDSDLTSQSKLTGMLDMTISSEGGKTQEIPWKVIDYDPRLGEKLTSVLHQKCEENGEEYSYMSCPFSYLNRFHGDSKALENSNELRCLNNRQREYLQGICWETAVMYHRLNRRMREIIAKLYAAGEYSGSCYFLATGEKLVLS